MGLVDDEYVPVDGAQSGLVHAHHFVGGEQHVKFDAGALAHPARLEAGAHAIVVERELVFSDDGARLLSAQVRDHVHVGRPLFELALPIDQGGEGHGDQKGPARVVLFEERVDEGDRLDGLAQAHFVGQDDVGALGPREAQPVQALELIGVQAAARLVQVRRLLVVLFARLFFLVHVVVVVRLVALFSFSSAAATAAFVERALELPVEVDLLLPVFDLRGHWARVHLPCRLVVRQIAPLNQY
ncbi:hypothetical protein BpHYR1_050425 [Brachionus plicatilis]|uniref:Uncharacterized protein n=1 Tax=Brachionus plicatilis TaxID=10195 RepID=A0A3M7T070_BRAPC|nr:hypothetical protein BpHYR1_050425 [Brachionus plicatilis]